MSQQPTLDKVVIQGELQEVKRVLEELRKALGELSGKLSRDGYLYWVFTNGTTVGRKRRGKA